MSTAVEFWVKVHGEDACWRTATKKRHRCSNSETRRKVDTELRPEHFIEIGERYFDTGEVVGQWKTAKLCAACAIEPDDSPQLKKESN